MFRNVIELSIVHFCSHVCFHSSLFKIIHSHSKSEYSREQNRMKMKCERPGTLNIHATLALFSLFDFEYVHVPILIDNKINFE